MMSKRIKLDIKVDKIKFFVRKSHHNAQAENDISSFLMGCDDFEQPFSIHTFYFL